MWGLLLGSHLLDVAQLLLELVDLLLRGAPLVLVMIDPGFCVLLALDGKRDDLLEIGNLIAQWLELDDFFLAGLDIVRVLLPIFGVRGILPVAGFADDL